MPTTPLSQPRVLGYTRVSTEEQAKEGFSLAFQQRKIKEFCQLRELKLVKILEDPGHSGKDTKRPGLQELLARVPDPDIHGVVVYKLDRLSRSTRDLLEMVDDVFQKNKAEFYSVTEQVDTTTALGKFFLTIIGALAQMERDLISERTKAGMEESRRQGTYLGGLPLGFKRTKRGGLVSNPREVQIVARIHSLRASGQTLRSIAATLEAEGYPTKNGGHWHPQTVKLILQRQK